MSSNGHTALLSLQMPKMPTDPNDVAKVKSFLDKLLKRLREFQTMVRALACLPNRQALPDAHTTHAPMLCAAVSMCVFSFGQQVNSLSHIISHSPWLTFQLALTQPEVRIQIMPHQPCPSVFNPIFSQGSAPDLAAQHRVHACMTPSSWIEWANRSLT